MSGTARIRRPGFPSEAFTYFQGLSADNSKHYFRRHREVYDRAVHQPMLLLAASLRPEFGDVAVLRPQRDTRASRDKSPYKTYEGAYVDIAPGLGFWVHLNAAGLYASGRFYSRAATRLGRYRAAVSDDTSGSQLADLTAALRADGFTMAGDRLKTAPRGIPASHPRLDLLRHRTLDVGRAFTPSPGAGLQDCGHDVRGTWQAVRPLLNWFTAHAAASLP